ncbi:MAG: class I SAM-dependent methyltransferase [Methylococcales bacterium]
MKKLLLVLACASVITACHSDGGSKPATRQEAKQFNAAVEQVLAGDWRSPENKARDKYRHPKETLGFFGVKPTDTVVEITPGAGGWYTEVLVPLLKDKGRYFGVVTDPARTSSDASRAYNEKQNQLLRDKFGARADVYGNVSLLEIDPKAPSIGEAGSANVVLTFRNVHNWMAAGTDADMFEAFFEVLKPGGTLGVVEHRAKDDVPKGDKSGYVGESQVIAMALAAGFTLDARSEINANPKDTKDYVNGVWTLPPNLRDGDKNREKYLAIGESDRMTLRFKKPL